MPYHECPACRGHFYSAVSYTQAIRCPECGERMDNAKDPATMEAAPRGQPLWRSRRTDDVELGGPLA